MKLLSALFLLLAIVACNPVPKPSQSGFSLPEGDVDNGRLVFFELNCIACHVLAGTDFNGEEDRLVADGGIAVTLGGETSELTTYAELVTSIINPSHRIAPKNSEHVTEDGESKMAYYNEVMTVAELVDLVTFLKSHYELKTYPETIYPYYFYPG